jgi:beta-galactosidase GanA
VNDDIMHSFYMLHVLLGERVGAWFRFTGENHVRKGLQSLDEAKLIIAPELGYVSKSFAETLVARVKQGATLVMLDPDALVWDIETGSLASYRKELMGCPAGKPRDTSHIFPTADGSARFKGITMLYIQAAKTGAVARTLTLPKDARVLFTYEDGAPAVFSRRLGKGEVIVFGAMPFGNSELALSPKGWDIVFTALCDELAIKRNLPLWDFLIPSTGGGVATYSVGK